MSIGSTGSLANSFSHTRLDVGCPLSSVCTTPLRAGGMWYRLQQEKVYAFFFFFFFLLRTFFIANICWFLLCSHFIVKADQRRAADADRLKVFEKNTGTFYPDAPCCVFCHNSEQFVSFCLVYVPCYRQYMCRSLTNRYFC